MESGQKEENYLLEVLVKSQGLYQVPGGKLDFVYFGGSGVGGGGVLGGGVFWSIMRRSNVKEGVRVRGTIGLRSSPKIPCLYQVTNSLHSSPLE